jgi:CHAD domain-containing protein
MRSTVEREVKLRAGPEFGGIPFEGRELPEEVLTSTYYDTDDLRLADGRITLRRRTADDRDPVWQLKLPGDNDRLELEWPAPIDAVPGEVRDLLTAHTRGRPLSAVATLRTRRAGVMVQDAGIDVAEVVRDSVDVLDDGRPVGSFDEIEAELVDGDAAALGALERGLRDAGASDADGRPKLFHALDLRPPERPKRGKSRQARLAAALEEQYREILTNDPRTRLGDDPDALHDHRVAVRRLRAMLRAGRPLLDRQWADDLRRSLKQVGHDLAEVRDLDVLIEQLHADVDELEGPERAGGGRILERLDERRARTQTELSDALAGGAYVSMLNRLEHAVSEPMFSGSGSIVKTVVGEDRRARRKAGRLPKRPADSELHEVRKAVKRARYAAELAAALGLTGTGKYLKRAKHVQDVLGDHQDAVVAADVLRGLGTELADPDCDLAVTALVQRQDARRAAARAAFPKAWKRFDKRGRGLKRKIS